METYSHFSIATFNIFLLLNKYLYCLTLQLISDFLQPFQPPSFNVITVFCVIKVCHLSHKANSHCLIQKKCSHVLPQ